MSPKSNNLTGRTPEEAVLLLPQPSFSHLLASLSQPSRSANTGSTAASANKKSTLLRRFKSRKFSGPREYNNDVLFRNPGLQSAPQLDCPEPFNENTITPKKSLLVPSYITRKLTRRKNSMDTVSNHRDSSLVSESSTDHNDIRYHNPPHSSPISFNSGSPMITVDEYVPDNANHAGSRHKKSISISRNQDQESTATSFFSFHRKSSDFEKSTPSHSHHSSISSLVEKLHHNHHQTTPAFLSPHKQHAFMKSSPEINSFKKLIFPSLSSSPASQTSSTILSNQHSQLFPHSPHGPEPSPASSPALSLANFSNATATPDTVQNASNIQYNISGMLSHASTVKHKNSTTSRHSYELSSSDNLLSSTSFNDGDSFINKDLGNIEMEGSDSELELSYTDPRLPGTSRNFLPLSKSNQMRPIDITGLGISGTSYTDNQKNARQAITRPSRPDDIFLAQHNDTKQLPITSPQSPASLASPLTKLRRKTFSLFFDDKQQLLPFSPILESNMAMDQSRPSHESKKSQLSPSVSRSRSRSNSLNVSQNPKRVVATLVEKSRASSNEGSKTLSRRGSLSGALIPFSKSQLSLSNPGSPLLALAARTASDETNRKSNRRRSKTLSSLMGLNSYNAKKSRSLEKVNELDQGPVLKNIPKSFIDLHNINGHGASQSLSNSTSTSISNNYHSASTDSTSNLDDMIHSEHRNRTRSDSLKNPFSSLGNKFFNDSQSNNVDNDFNAKNAIDVAQKGHVLPFSARQYAASSSVLLGVEIEPPQPKPNDTFVLYNMKLMDAGFGYEIVDILSSKITVNKYSSSNLVKESFSFMDDGHDAFLNATYKSMSKSEFYTYCLYLYTYLFFLNLYYGSSSLFVQNILEQDGSTVYLILESFDKMNATDGKAENLLEKLMSKPFIDFHTDKVFSIPIDLLLRHFLFYNKLPQETEKIDLVLEIISLNYYYFINLSHLKSWNADYKMKNKEDDFDDTVIIHRPDDTDIEKSINADEIDLDDVDTSKVTIFNSVSEIYTLLFVLLVLQTDRFNKSNKSKMLQQDFINIINNFKKEDFKKVKLEKGGAKVSETDDSFLLFNLLTNEIIDYFYENMTSTPLKSIRDIISPSFHTRNSSVATVTSLVSPTSPLFNGNAATGAAAASSGKRKNNNNFFASSSSSLTSSVNDPYSMTNFDDVKSLVIDYGIYKNFSDPFETYYQEFVNEATGSFYHNITATLNCKEPSALLKLDHSQDISNILFAMRQATIKTNMNCKDTPKPTGAANSTDMPMFVRIYKIGIVYKQEAKTSLLPKRKKKEAKRRSKNFQNVNLNDSDTFVWKKYFAMLTTFGIYIFKSVNWDLLAKFEGQDQYISAFGFNKIPRSIRIYSSSFFLQLSNSELELAIPVDQVFAYKYRYKDYNSFYICYSNSANDTKFLKIDEVDVTNEWMNNPKSNKVYNKGLFYSDSLEDVAEWVYNINYLAALHKCLPLDHDEAYTNLSIPGNENAHELTIGRHTTLVGRHKELNQELKVISKLKLNFEKILQFVKRLTPYQSKNRLRLKKLVNKIYTNNFRSLWFEEFKIKCFILLVEQTMSNTGESAVIERQRKLSVILVHVESNKRYSGFCKVADHCAAIFDMLLLNSSEEYETHSQANDDNEAEHNKNKANKFNPDGSRIDAFTMLTSQYNYPGIVYDAEVSMSPIFRSTQFRQLL